MLAEACPSHTNNYIQKKIAGENWTASECYSDFNKFEQRTLSKMKQEFSGSQQTCLASKSYFCCGPANKQVAKGMSLKQNPLDFDQYLTVLQSNQPLEITNRGFRSKNDRVFTYSQRKKELPSFYPKRVVLPNGIHTKPLDL